jgi:AbrB family transcriptional regulator (stage V sporulation protein T)
MKATGIVKRVGKSGQVNIPKNLRKTLHIRAGDPLEVFTEADRIIFKKFAPIGELIRVAQRYADSLNQICQISVIITDRDIVLACAGASKKDYIHKSITDEFYDECFQSEGLYCHKDKKIYACDDVKGYVKYAVPIIYEGDIVGCIASITEEENAITDENSTEALMIKTTAETLVPFCE